MTEAELNLADALLARDWRKGRWERLQRLHDLPSGALASGVDTEEAEYLYRLAENDVLRMQLRLKGG